MKASFTSTVFVQDGLVAGNTDSLLSLGITLAAGQNLSRGAVLGKITASGKYTLSLAAAADGSEVPDMVLALDADATASDVPAVAYFAGQFLESKLTLGAGHTLDSIREGLRQKKINLIHSMA